MKLHQLRGAVGARKKTKRVGRGNASGRGTYSGRGLKGQRSRTGGKKGLALKGLRKTFKRIPKLRGFTSFQEKYVTLTLGDVNRLFHEGEMVDRKSLHQKRMITKTSARIKIIDRGVFTKKLVFTIDAVSMGAKKKIEEKGGSVILASSDTKK